MRRVVVTGMGIWSCLGTTLQEVTESLQRGRNGIVSIPERANYGLHNPLVGHIPIPDLKSLLSDRRLRQSMSEEAEYAFIAAHQAFAQANVDDAYLLQNEVGILFGNDYSVRAVIDVHELMEQYHNTAAIGSNMIFRAENSSPSISLSSIFHLRGINATMSAACASGGHAIGIGAMFIRQGLQDMILVGGTQEVNMYAVPAFEAIGAFSDDTNPDTASCPFDKGRTGLIPSGGAAALVLEDYDHAVARGATILAEVIGYGFSGNGVGMSDPSRDGALRCMQRALEDAGISPQDIDYINAHATSTPHGDEEEAIAVSQLFANHQPWISSTKSMTGHECWMAGASEAVYSILMMQNGFIAPNIHLNEIDDCAKQLRLVQETVYAPIHTVLSNSFGFGGTNSTIILKKV